MTSHGVILSTKERVSERAHVEVFHQKLVPAGSLLMSFKLTIGRIAKLGVPAYHNEAIISFQPRGACIEPGFLAYFLSQIDYSKYQDAAVKGQTLNRGKIEQLEVACPPLYEQRQITLVLDCVREAIDKQEQLLALTAELKNALLAKLLTKGLRGEPQKDTEIGPVPESWNVSPLGELFSEPPKNGLYKPGSDYGSGTRILRINDFSNDGDIVVSATNRARLDPAEEAGYALREDDIVINRVNSVSHLGKTALVGTLAEPMVFESNMMRFRVNESVVLPEFVFRVLNSPIGKRQIIAGAKRAVAQSSINHGTLGRMLLPIPQLDEQEKFVEILRTVSAKSSLHEKKRASLSDLFRTLLHQLMTGQLRVRDLDVSALPVAG